MCFWTPGGSLLLTVVILRRLSALMDVRTRHRPVSDVVEIVLGTLFTWQVWESRHIFHILLVADLPNMQVKLDSVGREIPWRSFWLKVTLEEFTSVFLHTNITSRVHPKDDIPPEFTAWNSALHSCLLTTSQLCKWADYESHPMLMWEQWNWYLFRQEISWSKICRRYVVSKWSISKSSER